MRREKRVRREGRKKRKKGRHISKMYLVRGNRQKRFQC